MKRSLAILLLTLVLANVVGGYVYFVFRLRSIKQEMKAALKDYPQERLQRITMTVPEYQQAKNDEGEVEWQGFMHDVARIEKQGSTVLLFVLRDEAETNLLAFLNKMVELAGQDDQATPPVFTGLMLLPAVMPPIISLSVGRPSLEMKHETFYILHLSDAHTVLLAQPPQG